MVFLLRGRLSVIALALHTLYFITSTSAARADTHRIKWHDTGKGSIAIEEAWTIPESSSKVGGGAAAIAELNDNLFNIYDQRLTRMDANDMVLSCASPCIQGMSDPAAAEAMAINVNNQLAAQIYNESSHPNITGRFGAFAAVSMHNATSAAVELRRAVQELGFLGALVNDYQQTNGKYGSTMYSGTQSPSSMFQFTSTLRTNVAPISTLFYSQVPWLRGPSQEFSVTLSTHVLGLCTNGVFDRFPTLKVIVGHMGERIPSDLDRIDKVRTT
ncbi:hypothetical protein BT96DRAFT_986715 [Gymnopus androsaceus JB14]|uniref:Amidohydrolase-related domain-containing protein n=1 Tax=Gymnopus androsaceus JB14 TaxID=1447944 RepID=A0A6A4IEC1_9AGAR|nr:hypothetical protein BT96DRAFT_986715 [Gymnopus androsaceus JB14]